MNLLPTPFLRVDEALLDDHLTEMQRACDAHGVQLWPHIKTHKTIEIARRQLKGGARGLTVAKMGEAEALLPSGVRRVFLGYSLVDPHTQAARLRGLAEALDELIVAATSVAQAEALGRVVTAAGITLPVLMAVDTGLGREGVRSPAEALALAEIIRRHPNLRLLGLFTHEGHTYRATGPREAVAAETVAHLQQVAETLGTHETDAGPLTLWPGCSVTALATAAVPGVHAVRPGTYVFRDLSLTRWREQNLTPFADVALTVVTTVVDRPQSGLALVDGGSKTFSSDRTSGGIYASSADGRDLHLTRLSEEHGWVTGADVDGLAVGERVAWVPAHVCPAVNLAETVNVFRGETIAAAWPVAARGKVF